METMSRRQTEGVETFARLRDWTRGQAAAERLAAQLLRVEGFTAIDPSHPLGGPDGLKDVICIRDKTKWIGAAYFPRGQQSSNTVTEKFMHDVAGVQANQVDGFVFVTNQELTLSEREKLKSSASGIEVELLHLERIASILDSPQCYGVRLEFLDIEMTKEEQLAFIAARDAIIEQLQNALDTVVSYLQNPDLLKSLSLEQIRASIPLSEIKEFKSILDTIAGFSPYTVSTHSLGLGVYTGTPGHIRDLQVPLAELKEFANILDRIAGHRSLLMSISAPSTAVLGGASPGHVGDLRVPLAELKEFADILDRIAGNRDFFASPTGLGINMFGGKRPGHVGDLYVPLNELREYEATLDRIIQKLQEKKRLEAE
jgi:hypothetical protein